MALWCITSAVHGKTPPVQTVSAGRSGDLRRSVF